MNKGRSTVWFPGTPLLLGVVAVSFSSIFIKLCQAPAVAIGMYRLLLTVILLSPFTLASPKQRQALKSLNLRDRIALLASGLLLGFHFLFWIASLKQTSVASSMIITTLQPGFVGLAAYFLFGERLSKRQTASLISAAVGTAVIAFGDHAFGASTFHTHSGMTHPGLLAALFEGPTSALRGDALSLIGTIAMSGYMLVGGRVRARLDSTSYNWAVFLTAGLMLLIWAVATHTPLSGYRHQDWLWLALLALVPTLFGHALFNWLLRYVNATTISVTILGEPIGAILLSAWLLHASIEFYQIVGGLITLGGIWLYLRRPSVVR
ncbi:hypothetical protein AN477_11135 [Alicyclobacillus ferrooxydans]|uniref:EamA domain-containing protein n=1 Tax=Alicyclobacillus ferrooxydans TaxID=471514 RepID=A0A0N8PP99_9BACL|nr:hypothetical protein AN477_11135 [Alicyclobacillus ferrooxydans]